MSFDNFNNAIGSKGTPKKEETTASGAFSNFNKAASIVSAQDSSTPTKVAETKVEQTPNTFAQKVPFVLGPNGTVVPNKNFQQEITTRSPLLPPIKPLTVGERTVQAGNALTMLQMEANPKDVNWQTYLQKGLSFGNDNPLPGYKNDLKFADIPEASTPSQKIAEAAGNILTMTLAQPLIQSAATGLISKIPGGTNLLSKIDVATLTRPWTIGYGVNVAKAGITGGLFGLITKNKQTVAQNVLDTAGSFAAFSALLYPIHAFFKPIFESIGKTSTVNPRLKGILGDAKVKNPVSETMWFKNPKDETQLLKITRKGATFVSADQPGAVLPYGTTIKDVPVLTSIDTEAFQKSPSLYKQLSTWIKGEKPVVTEIPFGTKNVTATPVEPIPTTEPVAKATVEKYNAELQKVKNDPVKAQIVEEKLATLNVQMDQYHRENQQTVLSIPDTTSAAELANINVSPDGQGKFVVQVFANTPNYGISRNFSTSEIYNTEAEATADAKKLITSWADTTLKNTTADPADVSALNTILANVKGETPNDVSILHQSLVNAYKSAGQSDTQPDFSKADEELSNIWQEMDVAKAGERIFIPAEIGGGTDVKGISSTFPQWLPEDLRSKALFDKVIGNLDLNTLQYPDGNRPKQRELYNAILNELDSRLGVDTSPIRNNIIQSYGTNKETATTKTVSGGVTGGKGFTGKATSEEIARGKTQKEKVSSAVATSPKSIKEVAEETGILEPNVRRILGVGTKDGTFERVEEGVYVLSKDGQDLAWIETGNAIESLPRLVEQGFKADMVFLDIPYDTPAIRGGNRGANYNLISVDEFKKVLDSVAQITRTTNAPVIHMYSQAKSGLVAMQKYNDVFIEKGFIPVGKGEYQKTYKDGKPVAFPTQKGSVVTEPEGILVFTQSGKLDKDLTDLNFKLIRPKGYQTEKAAEMLKQMIEMTTNEGDTVLDPFAGSGVTGAEAVKVGRKAYLIEKNPVVAETITKPRVANAISLNELSKEVLGKPVSKIINTEIELGDTFNTNGVTNMEGIATVTEVTGRSVKFKDESGTEFSSMDKSLVKKFLTEGAWTRNLDITGTNNIIKPYGQGTQQEGVPDTSNVSTKQDLGGGGESAKEISGYDEATMLVESGNGPSTDRPNGLTKKDRQIINDQVEGLLEERAYSISQEDYTPTDRELMAAYSGAGGKESVGGEGAGLLNEYYTPQPVIDKLWAIAERLNPNMETAFEPSAGTGKIINSSPTNVKVDGAEISKVSGTIATILNPDSNITIGDFQELFFDKTTNKAKTPKQYDLLIGNPPFGERAGFLKGKGEESSINRMEEYFIKRGLDMTKEGGYLVYVVNSSFLKTGKSKGKEAIMSLGKFIEAYRLPENTFEDTTIGTDIVVFQKNSSADQITQTLNLRTLTDDTYFNSSIGGSKVLGEIKTRKNRFGKEETYVTGDINSAMDKLILPSSIQRNRGVPESYVQYKLTGKNSIMEGATWEQAKVEQPTKPTTSDLSKMTFYHGTFENFDTFSMAKAGENTGRENAKFGIFFLESKDIATNFANDNKKSGETRPVIIKEVSLDIKNPLDLTVSGIFNNEKQAPLVLKLISGETIHNPKEALESLNENIGLGEIGELPDLLYGDINNKTLIKKAGYDGIISEFGKDDNGEVIKEYVAFDVSQIKNKVLKTIKESKPFARTAKDSQAILPKKNAKSLVMASQDISNKKIVNPVEIKMLRRITRDMTIPDPTTEELKFLNYSLDGYEPDVTYFSGNVYEKIDALKNNEKHIIATIGNVQYQKQLSGLEAIIPKPVVIKDIIFDPIDRHIANTQTLDENSTEAKNISVLSAFTRYIRSNNVSLSPRVSKYDVIRYVTGEQASKETKPIMGLIKNDAKRLFNHFVKNELSGDTQKAIADTYNKQKNGYVRPDYSRLPVEVKDMATDFRGREFRMSQTQKEGVGFLVNKGSGAIAYGVGVGKTHTLAIATKANLDKGWTKRPLFTVPKSTIDKTWIATLHDMFPTLTINNLEGLQAPVVARLKRERGPDPKNWIQDGELTIISHEGLLRLGFKEDELRNAAGDLNDALWTDPGTKRGAEKSKTKYDEILGNAQKYVTDIMFSDLGFDHISVDEVHNFRKIFQGAKPENVDENGKAVGKKRYGNVVGGTPSKRAQQLFLITQQIQKNNANRNVFLASATPFENHATEVYNILSLVARDRMKQMGLLNINDFFSVFANFEVELDRKLNGEWLNTEKMKSFSNLPALQSLIKEFIDFQEDKTLVRPERRVITPQLQMSDLQIENLQKIQDLLRGVSVDPEDSTMVSTKGKVEDGAFLKASTYSIANGVSPHFIKEYTKTPPTAEEIVDSSPKIKYTLEALKTMKADKKTKDFGTFVFLGKQGVEYHPMLAEYFAKELGYKKSEVAYLSGDITDDQKEVVKEKFNNGEIKVLLGGDQTKEGIDLQNNGFATINLALGWNPTQIQQVEGRVWRQGNRRNIAPLIYPLVENSGDVMIYNKFEEKGGRINDLFSYAGTIFDVGEIDPAEKKLALLTNPEDKAKMQIEINKVALYNERVLIDNDAKELIKLRADLNQTKENIPYLEKQVADTDWSVERKKQYQKDLKRDKERLVRLENKLEAKGIKDINASISNFESDVMAIDTKIKEIDKTYPGVLADFTEKYNEQVKLRKTMPQHMDEIKSLISQVNERTPTEIDALRNEKIAKLEAERAHFDENAPIAYKGSGSANASIGVFRDGTPVELGSLDAIRPVELPEMIRLARQLTGLMPKVKVKLGTKLGLIRPRTGEMLLRADQFVQGNEAQLAKLMAHEIGHIADLLPDNVSGRGNLIGRIFSLNKFMASTFNTGTGQPLDLASIRKQAFREVLAEKRVAYGDYLTSLAVREGLKPAIRARMSAIIDDTGAIRNSTIKNELTSVSEYWRPYDVENSSAGYANYRNSPKELYADAISVLLNSPGTLEKMAPTFYKEFFNALDTKPELKANYFELQELLSGSTEEIFKARKDDIRTGFARAESIQADFAAKKKLAVKRYWERLRQQLDDVNYPILKKQALAEANGIVIPEEDNLKFVLQEESFVDNENFLLVDDIDTNIVKPIEAAGMTVDDMGEFLMLNRIQKDRADIANPFGFNTKNASQQLEHLKTSIGDSNYALLAEKAQYFHDLIFKTSEEAVRVGSYNREAFDNKVAPNKDSWAAFQVVDYMQDYMPATLKGQIGTLKEIANPFTSTILKTIALNRLNAHQRAKNAAVKELIKNYPDEIALTKTITTDGKLKIFKVAKDRGALELLVDGKMVSYDVDPYIAESFSHMKAGDLNVFVSLIDKFNNTLFKPIVTTYNLGFAAAFNPIRDFKRNYKSIPNATVFNLLTEYVKSLPTAVRYAKGKTDAFSRELVQSKAINAPVNDYNFDPRDDEMGRILIRYGLVKEDVPATNRSIRILRQVLLKPVMQVLEGIRFTANTLEIVSKVAGAKLRIKGGESGKELAYNVRNFTGTPNYKVRGLETGTTNAIFVFSNIMKEGLKADFRIATNPKTRSGYWWKTVKIDLLPKLLMFLAGAGLVGAIAKKFYDDVSEYDKTNYLIIPLGFASNGKAIYMRIPHDENGRLVSAAFWKMANAVKNGGEPKDLQDIFALGAGQLPSVTPAISIPIAWSQYLSGKNPYDSFRGRTLIDDTTFSAGGGAALKKMVQWTTNNIGVSKFATFDTSKNTGIETFMQTAPWFSSIIKISDYGIQEKQKAIKTEEKSIAAKQTLADRDIIAKYVAEARAGKSTLLFAASKYRNDIIKEALGGHLPKSQEDQTRADSIMTKFKRALKYGLNEDTRVNELIGATNAAKVTILNDLKSGMSTAEWSTFRQGLLQDKIVTGEVMFKVK